MSDFEPLLVLSKPETRAVWLTPDNMIGMHALIHYLQGLERNTSAGRIPGLFELVMHYRQLRTAKAVEGVAPGPQGM